MKTTTQQQLWIHDNGAISCEEHFGNYAQAELGHSPRARLLQTPLGTWERMSRADIAQLATMIGREPMCETCEADVRSRKHIKLVK